MGKSLKYAIEFSSSKLKVLGSEKVRVAAAEKEMGYKKKPAPQKSDCNAQSTKKPTKAGLK